MTIDISKQPPLTAQEEFEQLKRDPAWVQRFNTGDHIARREVDALVQRMADEAEAERKKQREEFLAGHADGTA